MRDSRRTGTMNRREYRGLETFELTMRRLFVLLTVLLIGSTPNRADMGFPGMKPAKVTIRIHSDVTILSFLRPDSVWRHVDDFDLPATSKNRSNDERNGHSKCVG